MVEHVELNDTSSHSTIVRVRITPHSAYTEHSADRIPKILVRIRKSPDVTASSKRGCTVPEELVIDSRVYMVVS
jgi:hypothetical protein